MASTSTSVNIKMYRVGELGDCFLLTIKEDTLVKYMLIDCGSFRNGDESRKQLQRIVEDIKKQVKNDKLDVVVGSHQDNDHVSGFVHCEKIFKKIGVKQVWLSWLDDPRDEQAAGIGENHTALRKTLKEASGKISELLGSTRGKNINAPAHNSLKETKGLVDGLLGFYGAAPELPAKGIGILKSIGTNPPKYLKPGDLKVIPGISQKAIKIHVLGPPKDEELLYRKDPKKGESYDELKSMGSMSLQFLSALKNKSKTKEKDQEDFPFNRDYKRPAAENPSSSELKKVAAAYKAPENEWRNIDNDWLEQAVRLALYMDTYTNNSSLVLAIELVKSEKVLLFVADAQTGNWISWSDVKFQDKNITLDNLISRTVFYKVGHHGSHNATLKGLLEKMTNKHLVAMIPVDKTDPNIVKENGWKMPAQNLYEKLKEKTRQRVLLMDDGFADDCDPAKNPKAKSSWSKLSSKPKITDLFIEFTVK